MNSSRQTNEVRKESLVPPIVAAILSLILPGLGHTLARAFRRGLVLFVSLASMVGLLAWRIKLAARFDEGFWPIVKKAFY